MRTFKMGGVHPHENKNTRDCPIEIVMPQEGEMLIFPLLQHIGAPCEPIVAVGERVLVGQKIADCKAAFSAPIHASVSGTVKEIKKANTATGTEVNSIFIESDAKMEEHPSINHEPVDVEALSVEECIGIIREAGIVGLGGAGFPAHIKLSPPKDKKIEYVIMNASECEPNLTTDHRVMLEEGERIVRGFKVVLRIFPMAKGLIGIETNKPDAIKNLQDLTKFEPRIEIVPLVPKYPQGGEKQLIFACTGREVPSGALPADVGCIVNNVDTVMAYDRAIHRGRPLMRRIVTLDGGALNKTGNFKVRIGQTFENLVKAVGGFKEEPAKVISGGPMMGVALFDLNVPIMKTSSALLCLTAKEAEVPEQTNCIRCAKCVEHCPAGLMPLVLNQCAINGDNDKFAKNNGLDCIECGCCSYVCPAKRHLAQSIRALRRELLAKRKK